MCSVGKSEKIWSEILQKKNKIGTWVGRESSLTKFLLYLTLKVLWHFSSKNHSKLPIPER